MFKKPRGQYLIINVYNINETIHPWFDLVVKLLSDLFRQLYLNVIVYSDYNGDDLGAEIYHDHVFDLFSNINCPNLAGKPKLVFIQCPVGDTGCHVQIPSNASLDDLAFGDECDSMQRHHLPTMTDMLIAFPSQKDFTAFRKPHVGSWHKNALVDILARHAKDTDLYSMLNMVNGCVPREVANKGKKCGNFGFHPRVMCTAKSAWDM
ncbi:unnamed protein product [Rotaria magnacalcarata]|uniref:Uncharacterized protein n=1 Tax=Rotaria magnacalcarata TaxID=392030 RepID=A0A816VGH3_9BILA|nr:unnamed protein product [Rotaria magnacalcarata]CAF4222416.1 unnamed protein product [Rotaria magnacalcarata]